MIFLNIKLSLPHDWQRVDFFAIRFWAFWMLGIIAGILIAYCSPVFVSFFIPQVLAAPVTIIGLLLGLAIPLTICWIAQLIKHRWILLMYALGKGCVYGFLLGSFRSFFPSHFLLIGVMYLFADTVMLFPVLTLCNRCFNRQQKLSIRSLYSYVIIALTIVSIDYFLVSPFLQIYFK